MGHRRRCRRVRAPRPSRGAVAAADVDAVLGGEPRRRGSGAQNDANLEGDLANVADAFVRDRLVAPAVDAAVERVRGGAAKRRGLFGGATAAPAAEDVDAPRAFYDVVRAADVAATSWRGRLGELSQTAAASPALDAVLSNALDAAFACVVIERSVGSTPNVAKNSTGCSRTLGRVNVAKNSTGC